MTPDPITVLVPGPLDARTGGSEYDRQIVEALRARGYSVEFTALDSSFPTPTPTARHHAAQQLARLPDGAIVIVDGLAFGALPDEAAREAQRLRLVALVHHPLAMETGLARELSDALRESETRALQSASRVVVTSPQTARLLPAFGVAAEAALVVVPGTAPAPLAQGSDGQHGVELLCVATLIPRKGHEMLVHALAGLRELPWRLTCVGSLEMHPPTATAVQDLVQRAGLASRVVLAGSQEPAQVADFYHRSDVMVLPTFYEGYGMAVAEALARGIPVVATSTGAIADLVGADAGLLVPVGDETALSTALRSVIEDAPLRARLQAGARQARERLPTWDSSAATLAEALERLRGTRPPHGSVQR
jgi:glycosyltransferase involved in cell wall biosynthesis